MLTRNFLLSVNEYVFNDYYDIFKGKMKTKFDDENKIVNFLGVDVNSITNTRNNSKGSTINNTKNKQYVSNNYNIYQLNEERNNINQPDQYDFLMNPKLLPNKTETKESTLEIIKSTFYDIKSSDNCSLSPFIKFHLTFNRLNSLDNENKTNCKAYCVFPNLNLEMKRINKITLSKNNLSKFLVNGKFDPPISDINISKSLSSGYLALSSKHRLITLTKEEQSMKEILFGIWINLHEEKISKSTLNEQMLNIYLEKHKNKIWEKATQFLIQSKKVEVINSPSPDEGVFLLIIFFLGYQAFYEVKFIPNEKQKYIHNSNNPAIKINNSLTKFSNEWLLIKKKVVISINNTGNMLVSMKVDNLDKILAMNKYLVKKYDILVKESNRQGQSSISKITRTEGEKTFNSKNNFKDPLNELFEDESLQSLQTITNSNTNSNILNSNSNKQLNNIANNKLYDAPSFNSYSPYDFPLKVNNNINKKPAATNQLASDLEGMTINSSHRQLGCSQHKATGSVVPSNKFNTIDHEVLPSSSLHKKNLSLNVDKNNFRNCAPLQSSTIENAYEIIYDQARSIQTLQEKISLLQSQLETVVTKLRVQDDVSLSCSCNKKNNKKSTGTNTSEDLFQYSSNQFSNQFSNHCSNLINDKSKDSLAKEVNNSKRSLRRENTNENLSSNRINNNANNFGSNFGSTPNKNEEDFRYENFLNENSINYPKQFLELEKEDTHNYNQNYSSNANITNVSNFNTVIERNFKLMGQNNLTSNQSNQNTSLFELSNTKDDYLDEKDKTAKIYKNESGMNNGTNNYISINKEFANEYTDDGNKSAKNKVSDLPKHSDLKIKGLNSLANVTSGNIDITSTSIDPPSYRYFLKVPSIIYKSNSSILMDDQLGDNQLRHRSIDTTRNHDYTINLPKIIFNESLESFEEGDN